MRTYYVVRRGAEFAAYRVDPSAGAIRLPTVRAVDYCHAAHKAYAYPLGLIALAILSDHLDGEPHTTPKPQTLAWVLHLRFACQVLPRYIGKNGTCRPLTGLEVADFLRPILNAAVPLLVQRMEESCLNRL